MCSLTSWQHTFNKVAQLKDDKLKKRLRFHIYFLSDLLQIFQMYFLENTFESDVISYDPGHGVDKPMWLF